MYRGLIMVFTLALFLGSCQGDKKPSDQQAEEEEQPTGEGTEDMQPYHDELAMNEWFLISYIFENEERKVQKEGPIVATFKQGKLHGSGGCNSYFTKYTLGAGRSLSVGNIGASKKLCSNVMRQESQFMELLKESQSYTLDQTILVIKSAKGELTFRPNT